jgi:hypothetical protein
MATFKIPKTKQQTCESTICWPAVRPGNNIDFIVTDSCNIPDCLVIVVKRRVFLG